MCFSTSTTNNIGDSQSVHFVMVASENHLRSVKPVAVFVVGTVLKSFLRHSPEVDGMASNDYHYAAHSFVAESKFVQDPGVWIYG